MSSSTSLARTRSLRKPGNSALNNSDTSLSQESVRTTSPSRLPVKGSSRIASQATSTTGAGNGNGNGGSNPTGAVPKSRPTSGIFGRIGPSTRQQPQGNASVASTATSRPPITTRNRPTATRPTSASGTPSTTLSRPTTSSGLPSSATARPAAAAKGHSRTKSSATTLTGATILRPPSQTSSSTTAPAAAATTTAPTERTRYPAPRSLHQRKPSAASAVSTAPSTLTTRQTRSQTETTPPTTIRHAQKPSLSSATTAQSTPERTQTQAPQQQQPRLRPTFNTLQQHYSPAKSLAPKPLTATYLAPPSPSKLPANVAASAETSRLQTELLQLHLLLRDAPSTTAAWKDSARQTLAGRFRTVAREADDVGRLETGVVERLNAAALRDWMREDAGGRGRGRPVPRGLEEDKIQALDVVLSNVWSLGEPGGKYARLVWRFEKWAEGAAGVIEARKGKGNGGEGELVFVSDLDASWKDECAGLARRLDEWKRLLAEMGDGPRGDEEGQEGYAGGGGGKLPESSLSRVLRACDSLVRDMLAELDLMLRMERDAVEQENEWIRNMGQEEGSHKDPVAGAIWRVL